MLNTKDTKDNEKSIRYRAQAPTVSTGVRRITGYYCSKGTLRNRIIMGDSIFTSLTGGSAEFKWNEILCMVRFEYFL